MTYNLETRMEKLEARSVPQYPLVIRTTYGDAGNAERVAEAERQAASTGRRLIVIQRRIVRPGDVSDT